MRADFGSILFIGLLTAVPVVAAQHQEKPAAVAPTAAADEKAMMEAWMKASTPGEAHKTLEAFVGTFDTKVKAWMKPGDAPLESSGVSENSWALGGRYIHQQFLGTFMGMPFSGVGFSGYDNIRQQYFSIWMDNMSTAPMTSTGKSDGKGSMSMTGTIDDPLTGKAMPSREKITFVDADTHVMEMWAPAPDGKEFKTMEITYKRRK